VRVLPAMVVALALVLAGCGGGGGGGGGANGGGTTTGGGSASGEGDARQGQIVFIEQGCTNCHVFKDAPSGEIGRGGVIGPDLDKAKPSFDLVVERVTHGKGQMPAFESALTPVEIRDVAAYVSSVAGK
jgi:mono/diheme cytochrome c family protein